MKKFKRKPTEQELSKIIKDINLKLNTELKEQSTHFFKKVYQSSQSKVSNQLKVKVGFDVVDQNALVALTNSKTLATSFSNISSKLTNSLQGIIREAYHTPQGLSFANIQEKIQQVANVTDFRAETIARTEAGKISSAARKVSYEKQKGFNDFKFKWIGPNDNRTTSTSSRIKRRVGKGVSYEKLVRIVTEESAKDFPTWTVDPNALMSHWNSRHIWVKV